MTRMQRLSRSTGFSLLELLIAISIAAILLAIGIPMFKDLFERMALHSSVERFSTHLAMARTHALVYKQRITLAASTPGNWSHGWVMFTDANRNAIFDADDELIAHDTPSRGIQVRGNGTMARYVSYIATGTTRQTSGAFQAGTLLFCSPRGHKRAIVINAAGRVRIDRNPSAPCP